ncbi:MAG: glutathione S-transferase [Halieaceae bacterium]|nr:glutathione S-transferase [Halieaceae bacterium]
MTDYTLYYWPIPFRGQFVRAVLAHVNASWREASFDEIFALKDSAVKEQLVPHMGPPVLTDHAEDISLAQLPAILGYLGRKHGLLPEDPVRQALTDKIVADANDVLYEMTLHNGAQMWTPESWSDYLPRLDRWMRIFEVTGRRYGLSPEEGLMLGTEAPGIADLVTYVLWDTMTAKLPALRRRLVAHAPAIAGLCERIAALPEQGELRSESDQAYGDGWCSGQIEASLRAVL